MKREYVKELEGGKEVYKMLNVEGRPVREVETVAWDIHSYINHCLFPLSHCIKRMGYHEDDGSEIGEYADVLDRLYDAAHVQLQKMDDAIHKDMGRIKIITTNEDCRGGFLEQDFLEVHVKEEQNKKTV
jgi:hypothetical protein